MKQVKGIRLLLVISLAVFAGMVFVPQTTYTKDSGSLYDCVVGGNNCDNSFPIVEDVNGWRDLKWGDSYEKIKEKYGDRLYQINEGAPYLIKDTHILGLNFGHATLFINKEEDYFKGVSLFYNSDKNQQSEFKEIIARLAKKYGRPSVVTGNLDFDKGYIIEGEYVEATRLEVVWSFPSTRISVQITCIDKRKEAKDVPVSQSQIWIFYSQADSDGL